MRLSDGQKEVSKTFNGGSIPSGCVYLYLMVTTTTAMAMIIQQTYG